MIRLFKFFTALIAGVILGVVLLLFGLDGVTKTLVERQSGRALGVPVSLESAGVHLLQGRVDFDYFKVDNPEGFADTPFFLSFDSASADISPRDITRNHIEMDRLLLEDVVIHLDRAEGRSNYRVILDNLEAGRENRGSGDERTFLIKEVVIRNITVNARLLPFGGNLTRRELVIDEIVLQNVGSGEEATGIGQITAVIVTAILSAVLQQATDVFPSEMLDDLGRGLGEVGGDILKAVDDVIRGIGDLFRRVQEPD